MSELALIPWETIGLSGMAIFAVALVLTGKIVPAKDRDEWREQARESEKSRQKALAELGAMNRALWKIADNRELGVSALQSLREAGDDTPQEKS